MTFPKILAALAILLFAAIGATALWKQGKKGGEELVSASGPIVLEAEIDEEVGAAPVRPIPCSASAKPLLEKAQMAEGLPVADRIEDLFSTGVTKLPIVETVTYTSRVSWLQGRPAWIVDYANYYGTSRHFIARSLNHKPDYFTQNVAEGDRFNVFCKDKDIRFYLLIDITHCKMWFYYLSGEDRVLLKDYTVGLGRPETRSLSGCLTPLGKYSLGPKVAIYKPGVLGTFHNQSMEMIRVFGTRWIPFDKEIEQCSAGARGYGIHGAPWSIDEKTGQLIEDTSCIGKYDSDGCIRLKTEDMEELFSVIITKPTTVEIVRDFHDAQLPGEEKE